MAVASVAGGGNPAVASAVALHSAVEPDEATVRDAIAIDKVLEGSLVKREKFLPVARFALVDRLTQPGAWVADTPDAARQLFQFLALWRKQRYIDRTFRLQQAYELFSPDSDLLVTRSYTPEERAKLQKQVMDGIASLMEGADFEAIDPKHLLEVVKGETHYGLDLEVDLDMFEELQIYYSGNRNEDRERRTAKKFFFKERYKLPIFQRLAVVFKMRSEQDYAALIATKHKLDEAAATKRAKREFKRLPAAIKEGRIYLKLFKDIPKSDIEMVFPNTKVKYRLWDKLRLGVTTSSGIGMGLMATLSKVAVAVGIFAWFGALAALGVVIFRQVMNFINTRNKYLQTMARNLYSHALADNGGVIELIAARAADQDAKEDILLYSVLVKDKINRAHLKDVDEGVESFIFSTFRIEADFETEEALERLLADGLIRQAADGTLSALPPVEAAKQIDKMWDGYLDTLAADWPSEGREVDPSQPQNSALQEPAEREPLSVL
ncbi:MAG: hypothetical protein RL291_718 [Pseudomonadota bacterium]